MGSDINRFVGHLMGLVQEEMYLEKKDIKELLKGTPSGLQDKGVAIINLNIIGTIKEVIPINCLYYKLIDIKPGIADSR